MQKIYNAYKNQSIPLNPQSNRSILEEIRMPSPELQRIRTKNGRSEKTKDDGEAEEEQPDDVDEKQRLAGHACAGAVAGLTEPSPCDTCTGAGGVRAAAPVRHAVLAANGVRSETTRRTRGRSAGRCSRARVGLGGDGGVEAESGRGKEEED